MAKTTDGSGRKSRLGRGLSSLMQVGDTTVSPTDSATSTAPDASAGDAQVVAGTTPATEVDPELIDHNPHQPRKAFAAATICGLAASLQATGVIQPLVVKAKCDGRYELIAGERRLRAAKVAKLKAVPVVVRDVDESAQAEMALVENIQREDLNAIDRAEAYAALLAQLGLTQSELAARLGEDRSGIANHLRLLDLAGAVQDLVRNDKLALGHAKVIAGVSDEAEQVRLADLTIKQHLSVRNLERLTKGEIDDPAPARKVAKDADSRSRYLKKLGETVGQQVGSECTVKPSGKTGYKMTLHIKNAEQFDAIIERLGVSID